MKAQLLPLDGSPPIEIEKDITVVGRKETCDLQLKHPSVSKLHVVLVKTDGCLILRDLGSTNGTKVNGQRVRSGALLPNDKLSIAACKFRVRFEANGSSQATSDHTEVLAGPVADSPVVRVVRANGEHAGKSAKSPHAKSASADHAYDVDEADEDRAPAKPPGGSVELPPLPAGSDHGLGRLFDD